MRCMTSSAGQEAPTSLGRPRRPQMTIGASMDVREAELEVTRSEIYLEICSAAVRRNRATKIAVWVVVIAVAALTLLSRNTFFMGVGLLAIAGGFVYAKNAK